MQDTPPDSLDSTPPTPVDADIHEILAARWSPRAFSDRAVNPATLRSVFEAARWAPSSGNTQPWSFLAATRGEAREHARLAGVLNERNRLWAQDAPVLGLSIARLRDEDRALRHGVYDTGQAMAMLLVQATALGMHVHQMAGFDVEAAQAAFEIPGDWEPMAAFALGYRGDPAQLAEDLRSREMAPRTRRRQRDFVFTGRFGQPAGFASAGAD
jgi:nitroreductase